MWFYSEPEAEQMDLKYFYKEKVLDKENLLWE